MRTRPFALATDAEIATRADGGAGRAILGIAGGDPVPSLVASIMLDGEIAIAGLHRGA